MKKWLAALGIPVISGLVILFVTKALDNNHEFREPAITVFEAYPETINRGEKSTLRWKTEHATHVTLNGEMVAHSGNKDVKPQRPTAFTLTATREGGQTVSERKTVSVTIPLPPRILTFVADPPRIKRGKRSSLRWETRDAIKVLLEDEPVALSGNKLVEPQAKNTYTLVAINEEGQHVEASIEVTVIIPSPPPRITRFEANPASIFRGKTSTLHWEIHDADRIMLDGDPVSSQGEREVRPETTTTYRLTAINKEGIRVIETKRIEVKLPVPPKIVKFGASPPRIMLDEMSTLHWETKDATHVTLNGQGVALSGDANVSPKSTTIYELRARNKEGRTVSAATEVEVALPRPPQIIFFSADPERVGPHETSKLSWSAIDATQVTLDGQAAAASGHKAVRPQKTTNYILIARNKGGKDTADVTVEVFEAPQITRFYAHPGSIWKGDSSKLVWETKNAIEVSIDREGVPLSGEKRVTPNRTTTYTLIALDKGGKEGGRKITHVEVKERPSPHQALVDALTPRKIVDNSKITGAIREVLESGNQHKAKKLLREAGYPNGVSLDLDLSRFQSTGGSKRDAQIMAAKLSRVGIRVRIISR